MSPGTGYIEQVEIDWAPSCDDGSLPDDSALHRWSSKFFDAMDAYSQSIRVRPERTRQQLEAAGFVDTKETMIQLYLNPWSNEEIDKEIGKWFNLGFSHSLMALAIKPTVTMLGMSEDKIKGLCDQAEAEACRLNHHAYCKL